MFYPGIPPSFLKSSIQVFCLLSRNVPSFLFQLSSWLLPCIFSASILNSVVRCSGILSSFWGHSIKAFCLPSWDVPSRYSVFPLHIFYTDVPCSFMGNPIQVLSSFLGRSTQVLSSFLRCSIQAFYITSCNVLPRCSAFVFGMLHPRFPSSFLKFSICLPSYFLAFSLEVFCLLCWDFQASCLLSWDVLSRYSVFILEIFN